MKIVISVLIFITMSLLLYSCLLFPMNEMEYEIHQLKETKIVASDERYMAQFGKSVSLTPDGNTFIAGAYLDKGNTNNTGSVYVYKWNGENWDETKITASDGNSDDYFGYVVSIAVDGNSFIVGSPMDNDNGTDSGSVYYYRWNESTWDETKILPSDGDDRENFGWTISIAGDGNSFIAGAPHGHDNGNDPGSVYLYNWNGSTWDEEKIVSKDAKDKDHFGYSVSMTPDGNNFIVGAAERDDNGSNSGCVYLYEKNGSDWDETKINASDSGLNDYFGFSVSITSDGNSFIVGIPRKDDDKKYNSGSVYVYKRNDTSWDETKIFTDKNELSDHFGYSVSITADGNSFIAGAIYKGENGAAYIYNWKGTYWEAAKVEDSGNFTSSRYGESVMISADWSCFIVGAPLTDNSGAVYVYH